MIETKHLVLSAGGVEPASLIEKEMIETLRVRRSRATSQPASLIEKEMIETCLPSESPMDAAGFPH